MTFWVGFLILSIASMAASSVQADSNRITGRRQQNWYRFVFMVAMCTTIVGAAGLAKTI